MRTGDASIDDALCSTSFGNNETISRDFEILLDGLAWAQGTPPPIAAAKTGGNAFDRIAQRARVEATGHDLAWNGLVSAAGAVSTQAWREVPWTAGHSLWVVADWSSPPAQQLLALTRDVFRFSSYEGEISGGDLQERDLEAIRCARELLEAAIPATTANTLPVARVLLMPQTVVPSWYLTQIPETIGIGQAFLRKASDLVLAESIFHECLHEKYTRLRLVRSLLAPGYDDKESPGVLLPWSLYQSRPRIFRVNRLLSTLHVYAHLTALHATVLESMPQHHGESVERLRVNYERAAYLCDSLTWPEIGDHLGPDGRELRDWLRAEALVSSHRIASAHGVELSAYPTGQWTRKELVTL
ncbi:hypothetical protein [Streptosporangium canum]|uniref:hypothetical protein n=1 Tax=Streptosporangium canum TaxID=324952 RepID=UPI0037B528D5